MRRLGYSVIIGLLAVVVCVPAAAQDKGFSVGLGYTMGEASSDGDPDTDLTGFALLGRWQHNTMGWGAMAEIRDGEDDEDFTDFDFNQINLAGTYTWLRDGMVRPFVKVGVAKSEVDFDGGPSEDDTALLVGGGVEIGSGRWAFHAGLDMTEPEFAGDDVEVTTLTLGGVFRF